MGLSKGKISLETVQRLTWAARAGAIGDGSHAEAMACGEASAVQDGWPGVAVAGHDGCTAGPHSLAQAAARVDDPVEGEEVRASGTPRTRVPRLQAGASGAPSSRLGQELCCCWATTPWSHSNSPAAWLLACQL